MNSEKLKKTSKKILNLLDKIKNTSLVEKKLKKNTELRNKEVEKHKNNSLKLGVFVGLFSWLFIGVLTKNIFLSAGISAGITAMIFILLVQAPLAKKRNYAKKVEAEMPLFLLKLATEIKLGKSFQKAIKDSCNEDGKVSEEFKKVIRDINKGASFQEALKNMNQRLNNLTIKRACSNLSNIQIQGTRDTSGLKKLAQEMLLKQRIDSKEFSGKMVVYALVFIAVSAIVPAMFQSFLLIGSYFMSIQFTAIESFLITVAAFPAIDAMVLFMIESKTPIFLKQ